MSAAVRTVRLDTGRLNILTGPALKKLRQDLRAVSENPATRAIALLGRADAFSAGLDSKALAGGGAAADALLLEMGETLHELYGGHVPVVAGCAGHAVAAGAMLLLASDVRIGAEGSYRVGFSEVSNGLPLPELPALLARDRLDPRRLQASTLLGTLWDPEEAIEAGFLDSIVSPKELEDEVMRRACELAELPPEAYAGSIASVRGPTLARMREILDRLAPGPGGS